MKGQGRIEVVTIRQNEHLETGILGVGQLPGPCGLSFIN